MSAVELLPKLLRKGFYRGYIWRTQVPPLYASPEVSGSKFLASFSEVKVPGLQAFRAARTSSDTLKNFVRGEEATVNDLL